MAQFLDFLKKFSPYCLSGSLLFALNAGPGHTYEFGSKEVDQDSFIAVAAPIGQGNGYNLLLLEQADQNGPACWAEQEGQPTVVDPLLLNFDFTSICNRKTDSSGYSLRVNGKNLDWSYKLTLVRGFQKLKLIAIEDTPNFPKAEIEIGSTDGLSPGNFLKINLNPGWRFTQQTYQGKTIGHIHFTHDDALGSLTTIPTLLMARALGDQSSSVPNGGVANVSAPNNLQVPSMPRVRNTVTVPPPPSFNFSQSSNLVSVPGINGINTSPPSHRVVVRANQSGEQVAIKEIVPDAFVVNLGSQVYLQVGAFDSEDAAKSFRDRFRNEGFKTQILEY